MVPSTIAQSEAVIGFVPEEPGTSGIGTGRHVALMEALRPDPSDPFHAWTAKKYVVAGSSPVTVKLVPFPAENRGVNVEALSPMYTV